MEKRSYCIKVAYSGRDRWVPGDRPINAVKTWVEWTTREAAEAAAEAFAKTQRRIGRTVDSITVTEE